MLQGRSGLTPREFESLLCGTAVEFIDIEQRPSLVHFHQPNL